MADETRETKEENYEQDAYREDAPQDVEQSPEGAEPPQDGDEAEWKERPREEDRADEEYEEPAPELGQLNRDYTIPGVNSEESNPYRWHTGKKRDHGGEDAI